MVPPRDIISYFSYLCKKVTSTRMCSFNCSCQPGFIGPGLVTTGLDTGLGSHFSGPTMQTKLEASIYQVSSTAPGNSPSGVLDNDVNTVWNTGGYAPAWITLDLGKTMTLDRVRLLPNMNPITSQVTHKINVGTDATSLNTVWSYVGSSTSNVWLEADISSGTVARYVQVYTEMSDSWVAWASIQLYKFQVMHMLMF